MIDKWNKQKYDRFINELYSYQDIKYKNFSKSLTPLNIDYELIGVRFPILKKFAKEISKTDYVSFININSHSTFEENLIHGLIIGYINEDIDNVIKLIKEYIPYIYSWSLCDSVVANLHIMNKYPNKCYNLVIWCLNHKKTYYKRVGYVLLLYYLINDEYINKIFNLCDTNKSNEYYVKMAIAWLISECYINYPKETLKYLKNNKLDSWTHNKAIQKMRESRRITEEEKDMLIEWRK